MQISDPVGNNVNLNDLRPYTHYQLDIRSRNYYLVQDHVLLYADEEEDALEEEEEEAPQTRRRTSSRVTHPGRTSRGNLYLSMNFSTSGTDTHKYYLVYLSP